MRTFVSLNLIPHMETKKQLNSSIQERHFGYERFCSYRL